MEQEWREYHLNQSGTRGVTVWGQGLIDEDTKTDPGGPRWYKIQVIKFILELQNPFRKVDAYKIGIAHCTDWDRQRDKYWAIERRKIEDIMPVLLEHSPEKQTRPPYPKHFDPKEEQKTYMQLVDRVAPAIARLSE